MNKAQPQATPVVECGRVPDARWRHAGVRYHVRIDPQHYPPQLMVRITSDTEVNFDARALLSELEQRLRPVDPGDAGAAMLRWLETYGRHYPGLEADGKRMLDALLREKAPATPSAAGEAFAVGQLRGCLVSQYAHGLLDAVVRQLDYWREQATRCGDDNCTISKLRDAAERARDEWKRIAETELEEHNRLRAAMAPLCIPDDGGGLIPGSVIATNMVERVQKHTEAVQSDIRNLTACKARIAAFESRESPVANTEPLFYPELMAAIEALRKHLPAQKDSGQTTAHDGEAESNECSFELVASASGPPLTELLGELLGIDDGNRVRFKSAWHFGVHVARAVFGNPEGKSWHTVETKPSAEGEKIIIFAKTSGDLHSLAFEASKGPTAGRVDFTSVSRAELERCVETVRAAAQRAGLL